MDSVALKCVFIQIGILTVSRRLHHVTAELTLTSSVESAAENSPMELTCAYTGPQNLQAYEMFLGNNDVKGSLLHDCSVFVKQPDKALYEYNCPTNKTLRWTIKRVTRANEGDTWSCRVSFSGGRETADLTISVNVPVQSVTMTSPTDSVVTVRENTITVFVCTTSGGLPAATVRWFKDQSTQTTDDDDEITAHVIVTEQKTNNGLLSVTSTLRYTPQKQDNKIKIYCTANNSAKAQTSARKSQLNVQYSPDGPPIIQNFNNGDIYKIIENTSGTLSCSVKGGNPLPTLSWNCYNTASASETVGTSVIKNVTWTASRNQDRSCTCQSSHIIAGNQTVSVNVHVLYQPDQPIFIVNGNTVSGSISFIKGTSRDVVCQGNGTPDPNSYSWAKGGKTITSGERHTFNSIRKEDDGQYSCKVQNTMIPTRGKQETGTDTSVVHIIVLYAPAIGQLPNKNIEAGSELNVSCPVVKGNPPSTTFKWTRNDTILGVQQRLYIKKITKQDDAIYTCTVQNTMRPTGASQQQGVDSGTFHLNVLYKAAISLFFIDGHVDNESVTLNEHADAKFVCVVDSNPASNIKIIHENRVLKEQMDSKSLSFIRSNLACLHGGVYTCEVSNGIEGAFIKSVSLLVRCSPRPLHQIKHNMTSNLHHSVTLSFTALAYPEPGPMGFVWHKEVGLRWIPLLGNADLHISSYGIQTNLTIMNVSQTDYGQYRVTVTNDIGRYEQYLFLKDNTNKGTEDTENCRENASNMVLIVGITLGLISIGLAAYAICVTIYFKRKTVNPGRQSKDHTTETRTYINMSFNKSDVADGGETEFTHSETDTSNVRKEDTVHEYTDLRQYSESDRTTYDVIQRIK